MLKFKVGDKVKITSGKDKGREGTIERVYPDKELVLVPEVNMYKKHVKGMQGQKGGIYDLPRPLPFSKISIVCPKCKKQTRAGFRMVGDKKKRICKKCNREIDSEKTTKKSKKK
jgi:large subunit ribosomal protein L24